MPYHFDEIIDRSGTNCSKYEAGRLKFPDLLPEDHIPMWLADMDIACPQPIIDAMKARLDRRILGYASLVDPAYFTTLENWFRQRFGWQIDPACTCTTQGVVSAMRIAVQLYTQPGEKVLFNTPSYHPFQDSVLRNKRVPVYSPLQNHDGYYTFDLEDMRVKLRDPDVKLYFLCSPFNPCGRVWREEELKAVAELCWENNVFIFCDEIHADFVAAGHKHLPLAMLYPQEKRLVTATAPSKTFNIAGNQLANIIFQDQEMLAHWKSSGLCGLPNPLSIEACKAAYAYCADWVDALNVYIDGNFAHLALRLEQSLPAVRLTRREGTYLAWVDLAGVGQPMSALQEKILRAGVYPQFGSDFVANGESFIRLTLGCPRLTLDEAIDRLILALR